jgi:hypothetical protein
MCPNIRTLDNFDPPATDDEVQAAASQSLDELVTSAPSKDREVEAAKARAVERAG